MKVTLLVVGKTTDKHIIALIDDYLARLKHYLPVEIEVIPELRQTKALSEAQQKEQEAQAILARIQAGDRVVLLDEHGVERRSIEFASWMQKKMVSGTKRLLCIVGGPYGFAPAVIYITAFHHSLNLFCTALAGLGDTDGTLLRETILNIDFHQHIIQSLTLILSPSTNFG